MKTLRINLGEGCLVRVCNELLNLREDVSVEIEVELGLLRTDHLCEVLEAQLVSILKLSVVVRFLLNSIVCQMHKLVANVVERVLSAACSDVAILVAVAFETAIDARQQSEAPEIELASVNEQRVVNILLNDESSVAIFFHGPANDRLNFLNRLDDCYTLPSVGVLSRFDDPRVLRRSVLLPYFFDCVLILIFVELTLVLVFFRCGCSFALGSCFFGLLCGFFRVFAVLLVFLDRLLDLLFGLLHVRIDFIVVRSEAVELRVVNALLRVESQRQHLERVLAK